MSRSGDILVVLVVVVVAFYFFGGGLILSLFKVKSDTLTASGAPTQQVFGSGY